MKILKYILFAIVALVVVVVGIMFGMENNESVTVNYLFATRTDPLFVVVIGSIVLGLVFGFLLSIFMKISLRVHKYRSGKKMKKIEKEVHQLKTNASTA